MTPSNNWLNTSSWVNISPQQDNTPQYRHGGMPVLVSRHGNRADHEYSSIASSNVFSSSLNQMQVAAKRRMLQWQRSSGSIATSNVGSFSHAAVQFKRRALGNQFREANLVDSNQTNKAKMMQKFMMQKMQNIMMQKMNRRMSLYQPPFFQDTYNVRNSQMGNSDIEKVNNNSNCRATPLLVRNETQEKGPVGDNLCYDQSSSRIQVSSWPKPEKPKMISRSSSSTSFPTKLYMILMDPNCQDCISWLPHGRAWKVLHPKVFEEKVIPNVFRSGRYASFMRQVNGWGFKRITEGSDLNAYYHELFLRDLPDNCAKMRRPQKGEQRVPACIVACPSFCENSTLAPLEDLGTDVERINSASLAHDSLNGDEFDLKKSKSGDPIEEEIENVSKESSDLVSMRTSYSRHTRAGLSCDYNQTSSLSDMGTGNVIDDFPIMEYDDESDEYSYSSEQVFRNYSSYDKWETASSHFDTESEPEFEASIVTPPTKVALVGGLKDNVDTNDAVVDSSLETDSTGSRTGSVDGEFEDEIYDL